MAVEIQSRVPRSFLFLTKKSASFLGGGLTRARSGPWTYAQRPAQPRRTQFFFTPTGYAGLRRPLLGGNHVFTLQSSGNLWNGRGGERACCVDPNTEPLSNGCVHRPSAPTKVAELGQIWLDFKKYPGKITSGFETIPIGCADRIGPAVGGTAYSCTRVFMKNTKAKNRSIARGARASGRRA